MKHTLGKWFYVFLITTLLVIAAPIKADAAGAGTYYIDFGELRTVQSVSPGGGGYGTYTVAVTYLDLNGDPINPPGTLTGTSNKNHIELNVRYVRLVITGTYNVSDLNFASGPSQTGTKWIIKEIEFLTTPPNYVGGTAPPLPTGLTATPGDGIASLSWNPVAGATGYNIYRDGTKVNGSPITETSYTLTGLTNGTTYSVQVAAVNASGESAKSGSVNVTPLGSPPAAPSGLSATPGDRIASLSWNPVAGATGYNVYRDGTKLNGSPITETNYIITGLTNGTTYSIQVAAVNESGESARSAAVNVKPVGSAPAAPTGLTATPGDKIATLEWNSVSDATGYNIYRNGMKINGSPITETSYTITGLVNGTTYSLQVSAVNENGESAKSSAVNVTPVEPSGPPAAPTRLSAVIGNKQIKLSWQPVPGAAGYNVYVDGVKANGSPVVGSEYIIPDLENGQSYTFHVTALNDLGESPPSVSLDRTPAEPPIDVDVELPFSAMDTVKTGLSFLGLFKDYILLGLGIVFAVILIIFMFWIIKKAKQKQREKGERIKAYRDQIEKVRSDRDAFIGEARSNKHIGSDEFKARIRHFGRMEQRYENRISEIRTGREPRQPRMFEITMKQEPAREQRGAREGRGARPGRPGR